MSKTCVNDDIVPPIFKWAESLSSNLERLEKEIQSDTNKLDQYEIQHHLNHTPKSNNTLSTNTTSKKLASPRSARTPISPRCSVKSSRNITARPLSSTEQTIISFEPTTNNQDIDVNDDTLNNQIQKKFVDLTQNVYSTVNQVTNDGERIIADVAKKIWGKNIPKTFLTAINIEIPINDIDGESDELSSRYTKSSINTYSSSKRSKRRSIILPALEVQKEIIPSELIENNLGFPNKTNPDNILSEIVNTTEFENNYQKNTFKNCIISSHSLDIMSDAFWWFLINEFKQNEKENEENHQYENTKNIIFDRMSKNYVSLFLSSPNKLKDIIFDNYYDALSQCIFTCFIQQYPKSKELFTNNIKLKILHITSKWIMGCTPSSLSVDHWYIAITTNLKQNQNQNIKNNKLKEINKNKNLNDFMIATKVIHKDVIFKHSQFVEYYLKNVAKAETADKLKVKINMTFVGSQDGAMYPALKEKITHNKKETDNRRNKCENLQKELKKIIRDDKQTLKGYEKELQQQLSMANKNKKQFVKDILKQLIPNELADADDDNVYV